MAVYCATGGKGGAGKSTLAAELTLSLARMGRRVVGADFDEQQNFTIRAGVTASTEIYAVAAEVLKGTATLAEAAVPAPGIPGAQIVVATHELGALNPFSVPDLVTGLRDHLNAGGLQADDLVIDCPASLEDVTLAALAAADVVIGASTCEWDSFGQLERLDQRIKNVIAPRARPGAQIDYVLLGQYDERRVMDRGVLEQARQRYGDRVLKPIRQSTDVGNAFHAGKPVGLYKPSSAAALDFVDSLGPVIRAHSQRSTS